MPAWSLSWLSSFFSVSAVPHIEEGIEEAMPEEDNRHVATTPMPLSGKGIFVQSVERATVEGTPRALAEFAQSLGLDWVLLLTIWQHGKDSPTRFRRNTDRHYAFVPETARALADRGIAAHLWGWPDPQRPLARFVEHAASMSQKTGSKVFVINAEKPYYARKHRAAASELVTSLRSALGSETSIGLSSYGYPRWHPRFPWQAFAKGCDFGMPQIYDSRHTLGPQYPQKCMDAWGELFENDALVFPTWGASKAHTPAQMRAMISRTPLAHAASWWDMNHVRYSRARAEVIRNHEIQKMESRP